MNSMMLERKGTQELADGITFDYNMGLNIFFPPTFPLKQWEIYLINKYGEIFSKSTVTNAGTVQYPKEYYNEVGFVITEGNKSVGKHTFSLEGKRVGIFYVLSDINFVPLGDCLYWTSTVMEFQRKHKCEVDIIHGTNCDEILTYLSKKLNFKDNHINLVPFHDRYRRNYYATYVGFCRVGDERRAVNPFTYEKESLFDYSKHILGMEHDDVPYVNLQCNDQKRLIKEKYICIATKGSGKRKLWLRENGWENLIERLKDKGYRVLCVDKNKDEIIDKEIYSMPKNAENFCNSDFETLSNLLTYCDCFIGLSSGTSWFAWGCFCPVVLISGFTLPHLEFPTKYRVQNYEVCNGCLHSSDKTASKECDKNYECTKNISENMVFEMVEKAIKDRENLNN